MMERAQDYQIVGSYNNLVQSTIDAERTINMFEYIDPLGKKPNSLIMTSGIVNSGVFFLGSGGARATFVFNGFIYIVFGSDVFQVNSTLGVIKINTSPLNTITGYVGITANNATDPQVIFVDGQNGYIWDTVLNKWQQITDTAFPVSPIDVTYLDGFFIVANGGTNIFQLSELNNGLMWGGGNGVSTFTVPDFTTSELLIADGTDNFTTGVPVTVSANGVDILPDPLNADDTYYAIVVDINNIQLATSIANAYAGTFVVLTDVGTGGPFNIDNGSQLQQGAITSHPGNIVACKTLHRRLFLFSQNFTEVWENAGIGTNLPFRRNNSLLMEYGTPAIGSVSVGFDMMIFLSQDQDGLGAVMQVVGTESTPISNRALDFQLAQYNANPLQGVADARGILLRENGLIFYRVNFTRANHTFVYNMLMSTPEMRRWHEEEVLNGDRHPAQTHAFLNGVNYYGDYKRALLYRVSPAILTNNGQTIRRVRIGKPYMCPPGYNRMRIDRFQLDLLQGQADAQDVFIGEIDILTEDGFVLEAENTLDLIIEDSNQNGHDGTPKVFLSISKDGGQSYGNLIEAPMGSQGNRTFRTLWRKLGTIPRGQVFIPKIEFYNRIPVIILGSSWAVEMMPE